MYGYAFVVMPEHVHLLVSEPERGTIANAMPSPKISSAKRGKQAGAVGNSDALFGKSVYFDHNG